VFIEGKKVATLRGTDVADQFKVMVADYIEQRFGTGATARAVEPAA
jgi:(E)-4-hydroxy-3-methylbut-2-enyl-diphosphate synthase